MNARETFKTAYSIFTNHKTIAFLSVIMHFEDQQQCLSQELKKVRHMSRQAEKGESHQAETRLTKLKHLSHQAEKVRDMSHQAEKGDQALATWKEH